MRKKQCTNVVSKKQWILAILWGSWNGFKTQVGENLSSCLWIGSLAKSQQTASSSKNRWRWKKLIAMLY
jgi:hypothetical protein